MHQYDGRLSEGSMLSYSEREICEIVWLVASEHFYNITNIGLNIHSGMLCDISRKKNEGSQFGERLIVESNRIEHEF
jgi:hypothetical protein